MKRIQADWSTSVQRVRTDARKVLARLSYAQFIAIVILAVFVSLPRLANGQMTITPSKFKALGRVNPRYLSYNVEAVEVTGGRFWAPFNSLPQNGVDPAHEGGTAQGFASGPRFRYRPPLDLYNPKLRKLAAALGPAYVRVSGSWRNSTYFQDNDEPVLKTAPPGFQNVMTRAEWKGVVDFANAVGADIVSSVSNSAGTHDQNGLWNPTQAKAFFDYTKKVGGHIAATEFMNEPTLLHLTGLTGNYGAEEYGRDSKIFGAFLRKESPGTLYLGPSGAAEGYPSAGGGLQVTPSSELMRAIGPIFDGFSYHVYYSQSHRCSGANGMDVKKALDPQYLDRNLTVEEFYAKIRDEYLPGKPLWLTETGEASCGGDTWASQFVDSFRLLDQLGSLAQHSVQSVMHNTLAASDYGLIDEVTLEPRPNYWSALLWKRTMGTISLDPGIHSVPGARVYAQCMKHSKGGVALLVLNIDKAKVISIKLPIAGTRYTLSGPNLLSDKILLNGRELQLTQDGSVPEYKGEEIAASNVNIDPQTITVITMPKAGNPSCRVD